MHRGLGQEVAMKQVTAACVALGLFAAGPLFAKGTKVSMEQLPAAVRATVEREAKGYTIDEIEKEQRDGKTVFEVELEDRDDNDHELVIDMSGKVVSRDY